MEARIFSCDKPGMMVTKQIILEIILNCILGVALALLNKPAKN